MWNPTVCLSVCCLSRSLSLSLSRAARALSLSRYLARSLPRSLSLSVEAFLRRTFRIASSCFKTTKGDIVLRWERFGSTRRETTQGPSNPESKVMFGRFRQLLAINAHNMAPRTNQWLQEQTWDNPTKGLVWTEAREKRRLVRCHGNDALFLCLAGFRCIWRELLARAADLEPEAVYV